ncbi:MAG: WD40 repeat domain-containing protein, partial [Bacteroidetes bacterium]|nr:WD40 repeat domain-containing protein [Bacteroidota bacterium]
STPYDQDEELYQTFLFRILVPYLAYQMEKKGRYSIASRVSIDPDFNFKVLLETAFEEFNTAELVELYPKFEGKRTLLGLGKLQELDEKEKRVIRVKQYLVEKLRLLVMEGDELRFLHQNFRDFYAACHIRTAIQLAFIKKETPKLLSTYLLPVYLRRMLGEIEGEHRIVPIWNKQTQQLVLPVRENLLSRVLDSCRGKFAATESSDPTTFLIWNIITIWQEIRQTLAGANLTRLDLRKINFNGKDLTSHRGDFYLAARFEESALDGNRFLFNGHYGQINMALYNAEGNRIVSASDDQKIIEWDTSTGELLQTYIQHTNKVSSVEFSPNRKKILSASHDLTLGERTLGTGKFRFINTGHTNRINHAVYSPDGQTILTASGDATIREFSVKTGKSVHTYTENEKSVQHISFHPIGDRFLSASADETIREWSVKRKTILRTMKGHSARVTSVCYSPDGNKAVSASDDHTIRIWNMTMEEPPTVLLGHTNAVHSAVFSNDGQKILSASADCTVREWSALSGDLLKIYEGHFDKVNSAFYSPDERKILSASDDKSIREWSVETGSILKIIEGKSIWVGRASGSFNPEGTKFLTVNYDKSLSEFSAHTGLCLQNLRGHTKWVSGAWYSPDGQRILSSSDDQTLREWSVVDGTCLRVYRGHAYGVKEAVYSKDGTMIFSVSFQDEYKEWSAITGDCLLTLTGAEATGRFIERKNENRTQEPGELIVKARKESILVDKASGGNYLTLTNQTGLLVQGCDFRRVHPSSVFTDAVKDSLRNYGALFTDEDEARWRRAVEEANKTG